MKMDGGGYKITPTIKGSLKPIQNRVLVSHMHFGEQKTAGGLIIRSDDGETRGIYPRWGKVYAKGPTNDDAYEIGDWVLVEHGRWTSVYIVYTKRYPKSIKKCPNLAKWAF